MNHLANCTAAVLGILCAWRIIDDGVPLFNPDSANFGWRFNKGGEFPGATGRVSVDPTVKRDGEECLKLEGDFTQGGRYVGAVTDVNGVDINKLSFWVGGYMQDRLTVRIIDAGGQCHQVMIRTKSTTDWQQINFPLTKFFANNHVDETVTRYEFWGGAKDGQWHGPAKRFAITIRPLPDQKIVTLWISDPKVYPKTEGAVGTTNSVMSGTAAADPVTDAQAKAPTSPTASPSAYNKGFERTAESFNAFDSRYKLYKLRADLEEQHNLTGEEPERAAPMLRKLQTWFEEVEADWQRCARCVFK